MTEQGLVKLLKRRVKDAGSMVVVARTLGCSGTYVANVIYGYIKPGQKIYRGLGFERVVTYKPLPPQS